MVSGRVVVRALQQGGFKFSHTRGSHQYYRKPGVARLVSVPVHANRDLPPGTLRSILRQADLTVEEFIEFLNE
jgi:predicted RNA binding protein YcfA (HicA-like mRNA interferase family)